jgi:tRNA 2-thiouridine synthesizing protein D
MNKPLELSFALMDAPFESARSTTALRLLAIAARRGCRIRVFAYEGAVMQTFARQQRHANAVHGRSAEEENHFLPKEAIGALIDEATRHGGSLDWVNCGLCVDERGAAESIAGVRRGTPGDFWQQAQESVNTLVIATRD